MDLILNTHKMKIIKGRNGKEIAILETDNCICKFVEQSGRLDHDRNMLPILLSHIPINGIVLDIGGFIGDHTIAYLNKVGENGIVYAFEPYIKAFECLEFNLKDYKNVKAFNYALGNSEDYISIEIVETNDGMNFIKEGNEVRITKLDTISQNFTKLDFIKIDCEGYELEVLKGGQHTIQKFKPKMLIEINEMTLNRQGIKREDIYEWLDTAGYIYHNIYANHGLYESQMDIIAQPLS